MPDATRSTAEPESEAAGTFAGRLVYRAYAVLIVVIAGILLLMGVLATVSRNTGRTFDDLFDKPAAIPPVAGPYLMVVATVLMLLGVMVFQRSWRAVLAVPVLLATTQVVEAFVPALTLEGVYTFGRSDIVAYALTLVLTLVVRMLGRRRRT